MCDKLTAFSLDSWTEELLISFPLSTILVSFGLIFCLSLILMSLSLDSFDGKSTTSLTFFLVGDSDDSERDELNIFRFTLSIFSLSLSLLSLSLFFLSLSKTYIL